MSEELSLLIKISADVEKASNSLEKTAESMTKLATESDKAKDKVDDLKKKTDEFVPTTRGLITGLSGVATAAWGLYQGYDRLIDTQVSVDRAFLSAKSTANAAADAQVRYTATVEKYGPASDQATAALKDLQLAQERASVAQDRATMVSDNLKDSYIGFALMVIPSSITMIDGLSRTMKNLGMETTISSALASTAGTVWSVLTGKISLVTVATAIYEKVQWALNAALDANTIGVVVLALAALSAAIWWAYNNVKPFHDAVDDLGGFLAGVFKPILDAIGGALQWLGGVWDWLTGQTQSANAAQTRAIEQATQAQLADIETRYSAMEAAAETSYTKQVDEASKKWLTQLKVEAAGFDKVIEEYGKHYDKLEGDISSALEKQISVIESSYKDQERVVKDALSAQLDAVNETYDDQTSTIKDQLSAGLDKIRDSYRNQTDAIKTEYGKQLSDTETYYDKLIGVVEGGLSKITGARNKDLDDLELKFLLEKQANEDAYEAETITKETYEKNLEAMEKAYNANRSDTRDTYRVQELEYEKVHAGELEKLQTDKKNALTSIKAEENAKLKALEDWQYETQRKMKADADALLKTMETQHETDIAALKATAAADIAALEAKRNEEEQIAKAEANKQIAALEEQRKTDIEAIRAEMKTMEDKFQADLIKLEADKAAERNAIVAKAEDDKKVIEDRGHADSLTAMDAYRENARIRNEAMAATLGNIWSGMVSAAQSIWNSILSIFSQSVPSPTLPSSTYSTAPLDGDIAPTSTLSVVTLPLIPEPAPPPPPLVVTPPPPVVTPLPPPPTVITPPPPVTPTGVQTYSWQGMAEGFQGLITQPTPMIVGEAGPEYVSITPMGRGGGGGEGRSLTINGPLVVIEGSADEKTARMATEIILRQLRKY